MRLGREVNGVAVADLDLAAGADVDGAEGAGVDVDEGVGAEMLGDADLALPGALAGVVETAKCSGRMPMVVAPRFVGLGAFDEVHVWRADEAGDEEVGRVAVELQRRADLLDHPAVQHDDLVGHGHRLDLVVGDVDHRGAEVVVQLEDVPPISSRNE